MHPIAVEKWIVRRGESGEAISRRRSSKRGAGVDVFAELVSFPDLIAHAGLTIELVLIHEEEVRRLDGTRGWRRKGWVVEEWRLLDVVGRLVLRSLPTTAMTTVVARRSAARIRTTTRAFAPQ